MKKKTHEEFLEELKLKNEGYRDGEFEIISDYKCTECLITVKTKFGVCLSLPSNLLNNKSPSIKTAVNKTEYFKNMCFHKFGCDNHDLSEVVYINCKSKIKIKCKVTGECYYITPDNYIRTKLSVMSKNLKFSPNQKLNQECIFNKIKEINPHLELLPGQVYTNNSTNLLLKSKYGVISVRPNYLLKVYTPTIRVAINKSEYFINQAREVHGNKYDYSLVVWVSAIRKVKIIGEYGVFEQSPDIHLRGAISKVESTEIQRRNPPAWNYSAWQSSAEKSKYFTGYKVYFIECWDDVTGERFFKIGRTYGHLGKRLKDSAVPYSYKVLHVIESNNAREICELEQEYKDIHKEYKYIPTKKFGGMYECFSKLNIKLKEDGRV